MRVWRGSATPYPKECRPKRSSTDCIYRYSTRPQQSVLQGEAIFQACAIRRADQCGREKPGIWLRLYAQTEFNNRLAFTEPEIIRGNLASALLKLAKLGVKDPITFSLIDPPLFLCFFHFPDLIE